MFFAVMTKGDQLLPVHSKRDMDYMAAKGWTQRVQKVALLEPVKTEEPKRKYTRKHHGA